MSSVILGKYVQRSQSIADVSTFQKESCMASNHTLVSAEIEFHILIQHHLSSSGKILDMYVVHKTYVPQYSAIAQY